MKSTKSREVGFTNDAKLRTNMIDQLHTDFVMAKYKAICYVANTIKIHIQKIIHLIYRQELFKNKQKEIDELLIDYLVPIMGDLDHTVLIEEWKQK